MKPISSIIALLIIAFISYSCEQSVYIGSLDKIPINNRIFVQTKPKSAHIYINNKATGIITPDTLKWLEDGEYMLTLKHEFFIDTSLSVSLNGGVLHKFYVDHLLNPGHYGTLQCTSVPSGANIFVDDKEIGEKTSHTLKNIVPRNLKVKFTMPLHRADSAIVKIIGGTIQSLNFNLDDTTKGLYYLKSNSGIPNENLYCIVVDSTNMKWIGTEENGIIRFDGKNWLHFNKDNSQLSSNLVKCLFVDKFNRVWIGLNNGLFVYEGNLFINYSEKINYKSVSSIIDDKTGNIWIGTRGGLFKYDYKNWSLYTKGNSGIQNDIIYSLCVDKQNRIWIGTDGSGIEVFDGSFWEKWNMNNVGIGEKIGNVINYIACDRDGIVWAVHMREVRVRETVTAEGGLSYFDGTTWHLITTPLINAQAISSLYVDKDNNKWVATKNGLGKIDERNTPALFNKINSKLFVNLITACSIDKVGDLYITTLGGGLSKLRKGSF